MPYYLFKNGCLLPIKVPKSSMIMAVIVDFMGDSRKALNKKINPRTYHDLTSRLWDTFIQIYESAARIGMVFDLYILNSIKNDKRNKRGSINGIKTSIHSAEKILSVEMDLFWALSKSKMTFQQFFL